MPPSSRPRPCEKSTPKTAAWAKATTSLPIAASASAPATRGSSSTTFSATSASAITMAPGPNGAIAFAPPSSAANEAMAYPPKLQSIIDLFESLPEEEKRENLISYSEQARKNEPKPGERFDLEDVRKDEECTDTVGVFLAVDPAQHAHFRISLGPQVQTLTK